MSLTTRVTLLLGMAAVVVVGAAAFGMDHLVDAEMGRRMDEGLLAQARALASLVEVGPEGVRTGSVPSHRHLLGGRVAVFWAVSCGDGSRAYSEPRPPAHPHDWNRSARERPQFANVRAHHDRLLRAVWFRFEAGGSRGQTTCKVLFMRPRTELDDILTTIDAILLVIPLLALLAVLLVSPLLVRRGLKPLRTLSDAMRDIGPQDPGQRLQAAGTRELEPLVGRFNEVLGRMDEGVARERQFAGALAHETRTHLAELRALVEVEQRYPSERPHVDVLGEIGTIVGELQSTVAGLLLLTRLEGGIEDMDPTRVNLDEVLDRHLGGHGLQLQTRRLRVERPVATRDVLLVVDRALLDIIIGNLLNNAAAYAPEGTTIGIRREAHMLVIDNDAPDIDADEVMRFGQRFWSKQHGKDGHSGLGLALAGAAAAATHLQLRFTLDAQHRLRAALTWSSDAETSAPPT